jgi:3',5'-cyclic AMP phosphodiesterase CpdA
MRVILVSDTHLSPAAAEAAANWDAVLRHVRAAAPDLVIHLGDLTLDGAHDPGDLRYGRRQLDRLPVPWHAVPGNHDVGDNPRPGAPESSAVDATRQQRWGEIIGADHWSLALDGWLLLAINAQLVGSGLAAEESQWSWLERQLGERTPSQPVALVSHKPMAASGAELAAAPPYRFLPRPGRDRLGSLFAGEPPALVLSGHAHQYRRLRRNGTDHLWVPTTWAVLPEDRQPTLGAKRCGIVSLEFASGRPPGPLLVEPDGIAQLTVARDLPDPYHR